MLWFVPHPIISECRAGSQQHDIHGKGNHEHHCIRLSFWLLPIISLSRGLILYLLRDFDFRCFIRVLGQWEPREHIHFNLEIPFQTSVGLYKKRLILRCWFQVRLHSSFYLWHLDLFSYNITAASFSAQSFLVSSMPWEPHKQGKVEGSTCSLCFLKV